MASGLRKAYTEQDMEAVGLPEGIADALGQWGYPAPAGRDLLPPSRAQGGLLCPIRPLAPGQCGSAERGLADAVRPLLHLQLPGRSDLRVGHDGAGLPLCAAAGSTGG